MRNSIKKYFKRLKGEASKSSASPEAVPDTLRTGSASPQFNGTPLPQIWTGVDLDGTLAHWDSGSTIAKIGPPVPEMLTLVKRMVNNGLRVKIFTARAQDPEQLPLIRQWLRRNGLPDLEITNVKDYDMQRLYDDRCIQVERNTGRLVLSR